MENILKIVAEKIVKANSKDRSYEEKTAATKALLVSMLEVIRRKYAPQEYRPNIETKEKETSSNEI